MLSVPENENLLKLKIKKDVKSKEIYDTTLKNNNNDTIYSDINQACYIAYKDKDFFNVVKRNKQSDIEKDEILLFHVRNENNRFIIESPLPSKLSNDNYDVLNNKIFIYLSPKDTDKIIYSSYYLLDNDIIKLGNIKYLVKIYIKNNYTNITTNTTDNSLNYDISSLNKDSKLIIEQYQEIKSYYESLTFQDKIICKICKTYEKCNSDNPMIKVCKCNIYYHFSCLKNMIKYYRTFEKEMRIKL